MHLQFDALILIAEPTPESTEVCSLYVSLANHSGVAPLIHLVGNKIEDDADQAFIEQEVGLTLLGTIPLLGALKRARQQGQPLMTSMAPEALMQSIDDVARSPALNSAHRYSLLCQLHEKLSRKQWVTSAYGDVRGQIDRDYLEEARA